MLAHAGTRSLSWPLADAPRGSLHSGPLQPELRHDDPQGWVGSDTHSQALWPKLLPTPSHHLRCDGGGLGDSRPGGPQGPGPERQTRESDLRVQLLFALMSPFPCPLPNTLLGSLSKLGAQSLGSLPSCLRRGLTQAPGQGSELLPLRETLGGLKLVPHVPQTDSNPPPHTDVLQHRRQNAYETLFTKPEC